MPKRIRTCLFLLLLIPALSGCQMNIFPASYEIDQIDVVQIIGVDRCEDDPSLVEVTFMSANQRKTSTETSSAGQQVVSIVSEKGKTVFEAKRKLKEHSDKVLLLGHIDYIIFGEEAAKDDIVKYNDCFTRDNEIRLTPKVYVAKNCTAKELMQTSSTGDKFLADRLKNLDYDVQLTSNFLQLNLIEIVGMLDNRSAATIIPALSLREVTDEVYTGEMPKNDVITGGYAVIKDFKLVGFLNDPLSRGYNFLSNQVMFAHFTVQDDTGMNVDLEVISSQTSLKPYFNGDTLEGVRYQVYTKSIIREQQSRENIYTPAAIKAMEDQLSGTIRDEMMQTINKSKELETDCIELGKSINMRHPVKWDTLKSTWPETFTNLKIEVEVTSQIRRTLSIEQPNGYQKER